MIKDRDEKKDKTKDDRDKERDKERERIRLDRRDRDREREKVSSCMFEASLHTSTILTALATVNSSTWDIHTQTA